MGKMLNDKNAAKYVGLACQTLRNWRCMRKGPPYLKMGRSVRYLTNDLDDFMAKNRINPEKIELNR
jgi:hypothetical protein